VIVARESLLSRSSSGYPCPIVTASPLLLPPWIDALPPAVARAVGITPAPAALRALFAQAPVEVEVELELPLAAELSAAARQLLKLFATSPAWRPKDVTRSAGASLKIRCLSRLGEVELDDGDLIEGAEGQARHLFVDLFGASALFDLSERFAGGVARLEVLQVLTQHMLASSDVDASLRILLSGLTSGDGLGFNRAAVFVYDEIRSRFVGARAVGPASVEEAHRIWEAITLEGRTFEHIITGAAQQEETSGLQAQIYGVELLPSTEEVARTLAGAGPQRFVGPSSSPGLTCLGATGPYVLASVESRGAPLALVFVDNLYSGIELRGAAMDGLATFLGQTSLVLDNLTLLRDVERLARFDSLTGVYNRREFEARMAVEEMRCLRAKHPCSLLVVDLDNFKAINDSQGHSAGDEVLKRTGKILRQTLRAHDLVGRYGGDEFTVLLPETGGDELAQVIGRLGKLAWEQEIAMSVGGASFPDDCSVPSALFSLADRNLLKAKRAGRERACIGTKGELLALFGRG